MTIPNRPNSVIDCWCVTSVNRKYTAYRARCKSPQVFRSRRIPTSLGSLLCPWAPSLPRVICPPPCLSVPISAMNTRQPHRSTGKHNAYLRKIVRVSWSSSVGNGMSAVAKILFRGGHGHPVGGMDLLLRHPCDPASLRAGRAVGKTSETGIKKTPAAETGASRISERFCNTNERFAHAALRNSRTAGCDWPQAARKFSNNCKSSAEADSFSGCHCTPTQNQFSSIDS